VIGARTTGRGSTEVNDTLKVGEAGIPEGREWLPMGCGRGTPNHTKRRVRECIEGKRRWHDPN